MFHKTFSIVVVCVREPHCKINDQVQSSRTVSEMFLFFRRASEEKASSKPKLTLSFNIEYKA